MPFSLKNNRGSVYFGRMKIEVPERWCLTALNLSTYIINKIPDGNCLLQCLLVFFLPKLTQHPEAYIYATQSSMLTKQSPGNCQN